METLNLAQRIAVWVLPVLFAITVHETAHGWVASRRGDQTARMLGRLSLNPVRHIDPIGTLLVPGLMLAFSGFVFGWAKPVPIDWRNLRDPRRDMIWVALGGPLSNLLMALFWALLIRLGLSLTGDGGTIGMYLVYTGVAGIFINVILMVLNLLPLPPLDGSRVVTGLLPPRLAYQYSRLEPFGLPILLVLLLTGVLGKLLWPFIALASAQLAGVGGLRYDSFQVLLYALMGG